jgi:hypothetical protein
MNKTSLEGYFVYYTGLGFGRKAGDPELVRK